MEKMNPENLKNGKKLFEDRYKKRFCKDTISKCINIAEEYGRIATLKEEEVLDEYIDYDFIEWQFNTLYMDKDFKINNWNSLEKAYQQFLEDYH